MKRLSERIVPALLIVLQVGLMAFLVLGTRPALDRPVSGLIVLAGTALGVWSILSMGPARVSTWPEPGSRAVLVTRGPYAIIRHPMYAALLLAGAGLAAHTFSPARAIALIALVPVLCAKIALEERALRARFPEYASYEKRTKRLIPFLH